MQEKEIEKWRQAGKLGAETLAYARSIAKPGMPLLEIAEKIEGFVHSKGASFAFPVNLSCNEIAAHYSPQQTSGELASGLLKVDIGISVDGYISDAAISIDLAPDKRYAKLIKASEQALENAIKTIKGGELRLNKIGEAIQETITSHGFSPVRNLSGHELNRNLLHAGITIPNYDNGNDMKLEDGVYAIEPFATTGEGIVVDGRESGIYKFEETRAVRDMQARKLLEYIEKNYSTLPFSARWLVKEFGTRAMLSLRLLQQAGALHHFKQLVEKSKAPVSQAEHTVMIHKGKAEVMTE